MNRFEFVKKLFNIFDLGHKYTLIMPFLIKINTEKFNKNIKDLKKLIKEWEQKNNMK